MLSRAQKEEQVLIFLKGKRDTVQCALELAEAVSKQSPPAVAACKKLIQRARGGNIESAYALERDSFVDLFDTNDQTEGVNAFLEKRSPTWTNS